MAKRQHQYEWYGYWLILVTDTSKNRSILFAWNDPVARQRRTETANTTDVAKAFADLIEYEKSHPLPGFRAGGNGKDSSRRDARIILQETTEGLQPLLTALAERAKSTRKESHKITAVDDLPLKVCMAIYKARRPDIKALARLDDSLRDAVEVWGEEVTVKQLVLTEQHMFIENRRALVDEEGNRQQTDHTILSRHKCLWAGMRYCAKVAGVLKPESIPPRLAANEWVPPAELDSRIIDIPFSEVVRYVRASFAKAHWLAIDIWQIQTGARPDDVYHLQSKNVDRAHRILDLREWNPETKKFARQSKKRCALLKYGPTLEKWIAYWDSLPRKPWEDPQFVRYRGRRLKSFEYVHAIAKRAGVSFTEDVGAYFWRHFLTQYLLAHGCPEEQVQLLLGHKFLKGSTAGYAHLKPDFMKDVVRLIEQLFHEIDDALPEGMSILEPHSNEIEWIDANGEAVTAPEELEDVLEDQPLPARYAAWFWEEFRKCAMSTAGTPVKSPRHPVESSRDPVEAPRQPLDTQCGPIEGPRHRGDTVAEDSEKDTVGQDLALLTDDPDKVPGSD
jgi:hypothetical protein